MAIECIDQGARTYLVKPVEADVLRLALRDAVAVRRLLVEAVNGMEALRIFRAGPPDVVLADINMPGMDGLGFLAALRQMKARVPVIAMSGGGALSKNLLLTSAGLMGAVEKLPKPFEQAEPQSAVDRALGSVAGGA